jgi:hypothetical protein
MPAPKPQPADATLASRYREAFEAELNRRIASVRNDVDRALGDGLDVALARVLGVRRDRHCPGRYEIAHTPHESDLDRALEEYAADRIRRDIDAVVAGMKVGKVPKAVADEARRTYETAFRDGLINAAHELGKRHAAERAERLAAELLAANPAPSLPELARMAHEAGEEG